jgi:hypothetical protein
MRAEVRAEKRSTLDALERHAPELCSALAKAGLGAPELSLELGLERRGSRGHDHEGSKPARRGGATLSSTAALERAFAHRIARDGVDTYA